MLSFRSKSSFSGHVGPHTRGVRIIVLNHHGIPHCLQIKIWLCCTWHLPYLIGKSAYQWHAYCARTTLCVKHGSCKTLRTLSLKLTDYGWLRCLSNTCIVQEPHFVWMACNKENETGRKEEDSGRKDCTLVGPVGWIRQQEHRSVFKQSNICLQIQSMTSPHSGFRHSCICACIHCQLSIYIPCQLPVPPMLLLHYRCPIPGLAVPPQTWARGSIWSPGSWGLSAAPWSAHLLLMCSLAWTCRSSHSPASNIRDFA